MKQHAKLGSYLALGLFAAGPSAGVDPYLCKLCSIYCYLLLGMLSY